jgi:hypothetical protein
VSHRTHHGRLIAQHTERPIEAIGGLCLTLACLALLAALVLTGCASTSVTCTNLEQGACTVTSTRLLTDSGVNLGTPDGLALNFSSKPNEAGTAAAFKALGDTIALLGKVVAAKAVPDQPVPNPSPVPAPLPPFPHASIPMLETPEP